MAPKISKKRWREVCVCAALAVLVWTVFGQTLHHEFVNFDDDAYVYENRVVRLGFNAESIPWAFTHVVSSNWHPLTILSHMLDCQLYGVKPGGHHLTNVLLHTATAILLFLFLRRLTNHLWPAAFVAAVFAIHPLRVESVAWVAERKDVLSGFFFFLTLFSYVLYTEHAKRKGSRSKIFYGLTLLGFILGLLSKPMLVTLPAILLLLDWWPLNRLKSSGQNRFAIPRAVILEKIPFFVLSLAACAVTLLAQKHALHSAESIPVPLRFGNAIVSVAIYVGQLFWPAHLAAFYPFPTGGWQPWQICLAVVFIIAVSAIAFLLRVKKPFLLFGWLWFLVMLLPVIGLIQVAAQAHADRYTYLPEIGLCIALTWSIAEFTAAWKQRSILLGAGAVCIIVALSVSARAQTAFWRDSQTLWKHALDCNPRNALAESNLAVLMLAQNRLEDAVAHSKASLEINPDYAQTHNCLGYALVQLGRFDEAIPELQAAIQIRPDFAPAHLNYGIALLKTKQLDAAIAELRAATQFQPDLGDAHNVLGLALLRTGQPAAAVEEYQSALRIDPDSVGANNNLAWLLATYPDSSIRNGAQAVQCAERAVHAAGSDSLVILRTLAAAYAEAGRFSEAIQTANHALQLATAQGQNAWVQLLNSNIQSFQASQPLRDSGRQ